MKTRAYKGFTLIEVLVYIAVLVLVAGAGVLTFFSMSDAIARNTIAREMNESATLILERVIRDARSAGTVDLGQSTLGTNTSILALDLGTTTMEFRNASGRIEMRQDGTLLGPLSSEDVVVDAFVARQYQNANTELVRISLTLSHTSDTFPVTRTYHAAAVLRGSYE